MASAITRSRIGVLAVAVALIMIHGCSLREWRQRHRLFDAVLHSDAEEVQLLLEHGLDPNTEGSKGGRAISFAGSQDDAGIVAMLIEHGAHVDDNYAELALRNAISVGHEEIVRALLRAGVDPNGRYYWGGTPVMKAAEAGRTEILLALLEYGGDPNLPGSYGGSVSPEECRETALSLAAQIGGAEVVTVLLAHNADASYQDSHGCTAAMAAKRAGNLDVVTMINAKQPSN